MLAPAQSKGSQAVAGVGFASLRMCFVCNEYPPGPHGGFGTATQSLARALHEEGCDVRVVGVYGEKYPAADYEEDDGVTVIRLRESRRPGGWLWARWRLYRMVAGWARAGEIDLVEVPDWQGWAAGWPSLPVPVVARLHGSGTFVAREFGRPLRRSTFLLERSSLRRADSWCAPSRYVARATADLFGLVRPVEAIIPNPVEGADSVGADVRDPNLVVFSGTLTPNKGVAALIEAWPLVLRRRPDARLHLFGKDSRRDDGGTIRESLEERLDPAVRPTVRFHGHVARAELFQAYDRATVAVFPSFAEAFGLAALEAMGRGCPTIFSRRCCGPELVSDGREGFLVEPGRPEEIAQAILRVLEDPALARDLGEAGRRRVERECSVRVVVRRNAELYARCIEKFRGERN
jgi:glycosyltransferase involved in cell wall biosynthesis